MSTIATTATITVDLQRPTINIIHAKQFDALSRFADIRLTSGGKPWTAGESVTYAVQFFKPDGTKGMYDKLPDGTTDAVTAETDDSVCTVLHVRFAPQMLTVAGRVRFSVAMLQTDGTKLQTFTAILDVEASDVNGDTSVDYYKMTTLDALMETISVLSASVNTISERYISGVNGKQRDASGNVEITGDDVNTQVPSIGYQGTVAGALDEIAAVTNDLIDRVNAVLEGLVNAPAAVSENTEVIGDA